MRLLRRSTILGASAIVLGTALALPATLVGASNGRAPSARLVPVHRPTPLTFRAATATNAYRAEYKCFELFPSTGAKSYAPGCQGHDEPAIDPISSVPGSGQDITWTIKLPRSSGRLSLLDLGPTFWVGATLSDPSSLADSVFSELQFYPDSTLLPQSGNDINTACTDLGFNVAPSPGTYSLCDFTFGLYPVPGGFAETTAYVSVVDTSTNPAQPLFLHSGDVVKVHIFPSGDANNDAEQVITDVTTGQAGSLIMNSNATTGAGSVPNPKTGDGPLTLPYSTNTTNNAMPWGVVDGTPFAFSWEIGHSNIYTHSFQGECVPGQWDCQSYDTSNAGWGAITPLQIQSVTFGIGGHQVAPQSWATNDGQGGVFEDNLFCGGFGDSTGTTTCSFPYYTYDPQVNAILLGTTYPSTPAQFTFGQAPAEYDQAPDCNGPLTATFGVTYFCDTTLSPNPPIP